jgi:ribosome-associated toxin RatA of RatAB toxin-antitoxin module
MQSLPWTLGCLLIISKLAYSSDPVRVGVETTGENVSAITLTTVIQARPESVWRWLTDYDHHTEFMPYMTKSRVRERQPDHLLIEQEGRIRILFWTFTMHVVQRVTESPPAVMRFLAVDGDFKRLEGEFELSPAGEATNFRCRFIVEPRQRVPQWAVRIAAKHYLKAMVARLREKAEGHD